jgi:tyrosyl-tRNA synthetase
VGLLSAIVTAGFAASNGEARRLVAGGGVRLAGERVDDPSATVDALPVVLQVGKRRFARLVAG